MTKSSNDIPKNTLIPLEERAIEFYEDRIIAVTVEAADGKQIFIPMKPIAEYLGLDWSAQYRRIQRDPILSESTQGIAIMAIPDTKGIAVTAIPSGGGRQAMICLPLEMMHGWLFGINPNRVKPALRDKIIRYQKECYRVLWEAFQAQSTTPEISGDDYYDYIMSTPKSVEINEALVQIREMGLAIAHMAEQQMLLNQRVTHTEERLDRASIVVRDLGRRVGLLEQHIQPIAYISDAQATEVAATVKALAELLTQKTKGQNHYQGIFAELYRRFGVSSYKLIRMEQYEAVLTFLEAWRTAALQ